MMYYVYSYYVNEILVYIGKATGNPYTRYWSHVKKERTWLSGCFPQVNKVGIICFNTQVEMEICELYLIARKKPLWNTRDVYPTIVPMLKVCNIPEEKIYSIQEFFARYGNGNAKDILIYDDPLTEFDIDYYKKNQIIQCQSKYPEGNVHLYYVRDKLVYIAGSTGRIKHKQFVEHFKALGRNGANFASVDRIDVLSFPTNAEANLYEKYCMAVLRPLWLRDNPFWGCEIDLRIDNIPIPQSKGMDFIKDTCRIMEDNMENICRNAEG